MKIKFTQKFILLIASSLILFIATSFLAANGVGIGSKEFINKVLYGVILYLWATWMYLGKHKFYRFFMVFVLVVYTFGFISFLFVPSFTPSTITQIILSIIGILVNVIIISVVRNERSKVAND